MPIKSLFGKNFNLIERSLEVTKKRHGVITSNVANLDTRGYRPKDIEFNRALEQALKAGKGELTRTHPLHLGSPKGGYEPCQVESGDWVDIDKEMSKLAENNLRYQTDIELLLREFSRLKRAISEGGR